MLIHFTKEDGLVVMSSVIIVWEFTDIIASEVKLKTHKNKQNLHLLQPCVLLLRIGLDWLIPCQGDRIEKKQKFVLFTDASRAH